MRFLMKNDLNDFGGITTINPTFLEAYNGIVSLKTIEIRGISQDDSLMKCCHHKFQRFKVFSCIFTIVEGCYAYFPMEDHFTEW